MTSVPSDIQRDVELLIFRVGEDLYGADACQVARIGRPDAETAVPLLLGAPRGLGHSLMVKDGSGTEPAVRVDAVEGLRQAPVHLLRRLPPAAAAPAYAVGVWLDEQRPVLLVDLAELHKCSERAAAPHVNDS